MKLRVLVRVERMRTSSESCGVTVVATASLFRLKSINGYQSNVTMLNWCPLKFVGGAVGGEVG